MSILTDDTRHNAAPVARGSIGDAIVRALRAVWRTYMAHRAMAAQRLLVASLSDRQLADLGLRRDQVMRRDVIDPYGV